MKIFPLAMTSAFILSAIAHNAVASPLGKPGTVASYELNADPADRPEYERERQLTVIASEIQIGPVVKVAGRGAFQWYGLNWTRLNGERCQLWMLMDGWWTPEKTPQVLQYLWKEADWDYTLRYIHEVSGAAVLPRISLWAYGLPQNPESLGDGTPAPAMKTPERIMLHGYPFKRVSVVWKREIASPSVWREIRLNPDLLLGWTSKDRDTDGRPHYRLSGGYRYEPKSDEDLIAHINAGSNFFVGRPESPEISVWLVQSPVYHGSLAYKIEDWPVQLYRSNYWGEMNHHDEPALGNLGRKGTPTEVAQGLQKLLNEATRPTGINGRISSRFGVGNLYFEEKDNPTWEVLWETAWYQMALPNVGGLVDEDTKMEGAGVLVDLYNMAFETQIPPTIENSCAIRTAVLRGAARNFNKRWGVGFYEPDSVKIRSAEIPYFVNKGATYFWAWTGWVGITDYSGLPYPYQRYYFSLARQAFNERPDRDSEALLHAAKAAVVIPYGYTFAPYHMHRTIWLPLEKENDFGVTYRRVLANAVTEAERLLRLGIDFDVAVNDPLFIPTGYEELIYAQEDGKIRISQPERADEILDAPRFFERPDLGPAPSLSIEIEGDVPPGPGEVTFKAVATIGTGDWSGEGEEPKIYWEIYDEESIIELKYSALWQTQGERLTYEFESEGTYVVRASVCDIFGRPAVAYKAIVVGNSAVKETQ